MRKSIDGGERGYPLIFFYMNGENVMSLIVMLLVIGISIAVFIVYGHFSNDASPDSIAGYSYAIAGTFFMMLAALAFTLRRRSRKRSVGQLNAVLNWHVCFGIIAITLLFLHSFGNFNPRTGTYALYGMVALVISGLIGRALDRIMPRSITRQVSKALTVTGDDRIESISQRLQSLVVHNTQEIRGFKAGNSLNGLSSPGVPYAAAVGKSSAMPTAARQESANGILQTPWDLAYISLDETPQELSRSSQQYRFVPDKKSPLATPSALLPGAQEHIAELEKVRHALQREQFLRYVIRYWRVFHISLAVITVALTLWHLEFAFSLLIPVWLHH